MSIRISNGRAIVKGAAAAFRASPNIGGALKPEYIVLHDTASRLGSWLTDKASKLSAHVVIGGDGRITQLVPFNVKARHAGQSAWRGRPLALNSRGFF
jgi:N-acetylmuramoyl-L-alanine amidase